MVVEVAEVVKRRCQDGRQIEVHNSRTMDFLTPRAMEISITAMMTWRTPLLTLTAIFLLQSPPPPPPQRPPRMPMPQLAVHLLRRDPLLLQFLHGLSFQIACEAGDHHQPCDRDRTATLACPAVSRAHPKIKEVVTVWKDHCHPWEENFSATFHSVSHKATHPAVPSPLEKKGQIILFRIAKKKKM